MIELVRDGGLFGNLLVLCFIAQAVIVVLRFVDLKKLASFSEEQKQFKLDQVLWIGDISFLIGIVGSIIGFYNAFKAIVKASEVSPAIISMGYSMALSTTILGGIILLLSLFAWLIFKNIYLKK